MNADEIEKAKELARALRDYASDCDSDSEYCFQCTFACVCDKCGGNAPKIIADLIDSLTAKLVESQRREKAAVEDLKYYLENNEDNGVVYIPKFAVEKIINRSDSHEAEKGEAE